MTGLEIDETLAYSSSGVGDDDGIREYPFITNPQVLEINRKLNELHRKILFQDFFTAVTNQDYDNCPKGSCMSSHFKTNVPGPYFSCPVLHESGDDFFPLPFPKRSARPKVSVPLLARGNKAKRRKQTCRKCHVIAFNHYDANCYYDHYLKYCTYSRLRLGNVSPYIPPKLAKDCKTTVAVKQIEDNEDEERSSLDSTPSPNSPALSDLKDLMDPRKPLLLEDVVKKGKKKPRQSSTGKIAVRSRYQSTSSRRPRQNINAMHINMSHAKSSSQEESKKDNDEVPKNPFPMPDAYEEIYFGSMPESFNTLPVALQTFKKIQMKMAGDIGKVEKPGVDPTSPVSAEPVNLLPRLHRPSTRSFKPVVSQQVGATSISEQIDNTAEAALNKFKSGRRFPSSPVNITKRKSSGHLGIRKSQKNQSGSSQSMARKSKTSLNGSSSRNRKQRGSKLTLKSKHVKGQVTRDEKEMDGSNENNYLSGDGIKYREAMVKFMDSRQSANTSPNGDSLSSYKNLEHQVNDKRASTPLTITVYKSVTELGLVSSTSAAEQKWAAKSEMALKNNSNGGKRKSGGGRTRAKTALRATTARPTERSSSMNRGRRALLVTRGDIY